MMLYVEEQRYEGKTIFALVADMDDDNYYEIGEPSEDRDVIRQRLESFRPYLTPKVKIPEVEGP